MLAELEDQARHIDADIRDLRSILQRHQGAAAPPHANQTGSIGKGEASREILDLMADGKIWRPKQIAEIRGTTQNAASAVLRRLYRDGKLVESGVGKYRIAPPKGEGAQGSLSDPSEGEGSVHPQAAQGVVDEMSRATA